MASHSKTKSSKYDNCAVVNVAEQELIEVFLRQPKLDEDGDQLREEDGNLSWKVFRASKVVEKAKKHIEENRDEIEDAALWLARGAYWHAPLSRVHVALLFLYIGYIMGTHDLRIKVNKSPMSKKEMQDFFHELIDAKHAELDKIGSDLKDLIEGGNDTESFLEIE